MASNSFNISTNKAYANSGITGVTATKSGNVVQLYFNMTTIGPATQSGYINLGTLQARFRPATGVATMLIDNSASVRGNMPIFVTINEDGSVNWYATGAGDKCNPRGIATYIAANPSI